MRKIIFLLLMLPLLTNAQKLRRDEEDKYTRQYVRETSRETLAKGITYSLRKVNDRIFWDVRIKTMSVFSVSPGDDCIFLLPNGENVRATCAKGGTASFEVISGITFWTGYATYELQQKDLQLLEKEGVKGVRIYFTDRYIDFDKVKGKNSETFKNAAHLIAS